MTVNEIISSGTSVGYLELNIYNIYLMNSIISIDKYRPYLHES